MTTHRVPPLGCQCDLGTWDNEIGPICDSYEPATPHANAMCSRCEHDFACHLYKEPDVNNDQHTKKYVVMQKAWYQASGNYDAVEKVRTLIVTSDTPIGEIMRWADEHNSLAAGDVRIPREVGTAEPASSQGAAA